MKFLFEICFRLKLLMTGKSTSETIILQQDTTNINSINYIYIYIWTHVKIQSFPKTPLASVQVAVKLLKGKMTIFGEGVSRPALFYTLAACYFLDDQIRSTFLCSLGGGQWGTPIPMLVRFTGQKKDGSVLNTCRRHAESSWILNSGSIFLGSTKPFRWSQVCIPGPGIELATSHFLHWLERLAERSCREMWCGKPKLPFRDGLYHPLVVILGMVYH